MQTMNPRTKELATQMVRASIAANDLAAGSEAAGFVVVMLTKMIAQDSGNDPQEVIAELISHCWEQLEKTPDGSIFTLNSKGGEA